MRRYPTRNGLAVPIEEVGFERVAHERRNTNNHHLYFDRAWYSDVRYRSVFRNLLPHLQTLRIADHEQLHDTYSPPVMPSDSLMIGTVEDYLAQNGVIHCVKEKKTNEVYEIQAGEWQVIKGMYRRVA